MPLSPPIIAFGIESPWMLFWLLAAAAPIVIHLLSRRKYQEMPWAAMEYLLAAIRRKTRRLRFEQILLLLLRTLLIVLLVWAVAEPFFERIGAVFGSGGGWTHRVLVIDASYSMAYKPTDRSRFDRAKELARQIVEHSPQGDAFTVVLMASPPRVVIGTPALGAAEVLQEIDAVQLLHTSIDLPATVSTIHQLIASAAHEAPHLKRQEVYFLTDLGRVGWAPDLDATAAAEFRRRSAELADLARVVIVDLGQPLAENVAVTDIRAQEPLATLARPVEFEVTLRNFGRQARTRQPVELLLDGRRLSQQTVELPPGGTAAVGFSHRFETPGEHEVEVRAEGDNLEVDNRRWMIVPVRHSLRVLCINGRPSGEPFGGAADYLVSALSPPGEQPERALVNAELAPESALLERDLGQYDCVFLCEVAQFTASEARLLEGYLNGGGSLVVFLGGSVLADRYNRELGGGSGRTRLLPARLGPVVTQAEPEARLDPLDFRHRIVQAFRGRGKTALLTTPVEKYFKLEPVPDSQAKVVLATAAGDPLIVEEPIRRGRVVLVATSADRSWTSLPVWPSFVPLVHELLAYCAGGQLQQRNVLVGEPFGGSLLASAADGSLAVEGPDGRTRTVAVQPGGDSSAWVYAETYLSGVYTARFGPAVGRSQRFAVNVNTAESDLTQLSVEELKTEVWPGVRFEHQTTWQDLDRPAVGSPLGNTGQFHVGLLYAVLVLLLVETFLAWLFGYRAA